MMIAPLYLIASMTVFALPPKTMGYELFASLHERLLNGEKPARLEAEIPRLRQGLKIARKASREYWTESAAFDELAKAPILEGEILKALGIPHRGSEKGLRASAGIMHTYGYLFSQLKTPYGLKGKRWIESRIDERLGLPAGSFGPFAEKGEFCSNVTAALFSLLGESVKIKTAAVFSPKARHLGGIQERVEWETPKGRRRGVVSTDLFELAALSGFESGDVNLLVYSVVMDGRRRLVTAFPVDEGFSKTIRAKEPARGNSFAPRFNLWVDPEWKAVSLASSGFAVKE